MRGEVAIIGGAGLMGRLFLQYFKSKGYSITISDIRGEEAEKTAKENQVRLAQDNREAIRGADIVLVSTSIDATSKTIEEVAPHMKEGSLIIEIASVKAGIIGSLKGLRRKDITPLSLHPLFGPGVKSFKGKRIALIPVRNKDREVELAKALFEDSLVIPTDPEEHDRAVAITISLTHFINAALASLLKDEGISRLRELGGPNFQLQILLCQALLGQDPASYEDIRRVNPYADLWIKSYKDKIEDLLERMAEGEAPPYLRDLQGKLGKDNSLTKAYREIYSILEILERKEKPQKHGEN
jgi:prephenate dehydrogenase